MTGDARGEAERIVGEFERNVSAVHVNGWNPHREASGREPLVAALAAAIEVVDAKDDLYERRALEALSTALSALRARAGEET